MVVCKFCGKDMIIAKGCKHVPIVIDGKNYEPIKVGEPGDFYYGREDARCGDCGGVDNYDNPDSEIGFIF